MQLIHKSLIVDKAMQLPDIQHTQYMNNSSGMHVVVLKILWLHMHMLYLCQAFEPYQICMSAYIYNKDVIKWPHHYRINRHLTLNL